MVLGLGETGLSLLRYLKAQHARARVADSRYNPPGLEEAKTILSQPLIYCGPFYDDLFAGADLVAISPGVSLRDPVVARAVTCGIPVVGDIELFAQALPQLNRPKVIAITGSNGKTTVTSLVEHLCKAAGKVSIAAGNISPAVLDVLMKRGHRQPDVWVLELSSFQLETTSSLNPDAATVLNVTEDHLDRYDNIDEYAAAKARIFNGAAIQVLNRNDERSMAMAHKDCEVITFGLDEAPNANDFGILHIDGATWLAQGKEPLIAASALRIAGLHNITNALAALALCRAIDLPMQALLLGLRSFEGLPHRVELVADIDGVSYYDDSKGTNVGATEAALKGLGKPAVVILGGEGKGQDFTPLNAAVAQHARGVVLIGRDAGLIEAALQGCGVTMIHAGHMQEAVHKAAQLARPGDAVLLSPACASFDMFRNYAHRAEVFITAVLELERGAT